MNTRDYLCVWLIIAGVIIGALFYAHSASVPSSIVVLAPQGYSVFVAGLSLDYRILGVEEKDTDTQVETASLNGSEALSHHLFLVPQGARILVSVIGPEKGELNEDKPLRSGTSLPSR